MRSLQILTVVWLGIAAPAVAARLVPVGSEFQVNSYTTSIQAYPAVAADTQGDFVVVWESSYQDGSYKGVFGQRFTSTGAPAGTEFQVNTTAVGYQYSPAVSASRDGTFVVVWMSYNADGSDADIFARRYSKTGAPEGPEFRVNTDLEDPQFAPAVAVDGGGNFVVVWESEGQDGNSSGVFGQRYDSSGTNLGTEFQINTYTTHAQLSPAVAADADGNFVVAWTSGNQDGSAEGIFGRRYASNGFPLGTELLVNSHTLGRQASPSIANDPDGGFVVAWESEGQDGSASGIFAQRYDAASDRLGTEFRVNTLTLGNQTNPVASVDREGNLLVAWQSQQSAGEKLRIQAQLYERTGQPAGSEFEIVRHTTFDSSYPAVAATGAGQFTVVWEGNQQDGDLSGIFGRRFGVATAPDCVGDCDGNQLVHVNELITGVNIAIGNAQLITCPAFDVNDDGEVATNELVGAVRNALNGCAKPSG